MEVNPPLRTSHAGGPGFGFDAALGIGAQFPQPPGERSLQAPQFADKSLPILGTAAPAVRHRILFVVILKSGHRVTPGVAEEFRPTIFIGAQGANDEDAALVALPGLHLLLEPFQLVLTPSRGQVTRRHDDQQNTGALHLGADFVRKMDGRIDLLVAPDMQIVEFDIDRPNIRFELADQIERPLLERRVGIRALNSMRIADEYVIFEKR